HGGAIVNVGSVNSFLGFPTGSAYVASKHGQIGLTTSVSAELAPQGIRVNLVCPGFIDTPRNPARRAVAATLKTLADIFGCPERHSSGTQRGQRQQCAQPQSQQLPHPFPAKIAIYLKGSDGPLALMQHPVARIEVNLSQRCRNPDSGGTRVAGDPSMQTRCSMRARRAYRPGVSCELAFQWCKPFRVLALKTIVPARTPQHCQ